MDLRARCSLPLLPGLLLAIGLSALAGLPAAALAEPPAKPLPPITTIVTQAAPTDVAQVIGKVQRLYDGTVDLHAHFDQTLSGPMGKRQASGQVWLKKPGKMRWDYEKPEKKLFVADGTLLWMYEPEDEQAFKQALSSSQLPAQVSFLFGKGKLLNDFDIAPLDGSGLGGPGDIVYKLVPKAATAQYRYLVFVIDPKSYLVKETVVFDQQDGQNRLSFSHVEMNLKGGLGDDRFRFTPPPGTKVIDPSKGG